MTWTLPKNTWTDERAALAEKLYREGRSASQIAKHLGGGVTRNAVIGKMHRMGVTTGARRAPSDPSAKRRVTKVTNGVASAHKLIAAKIRAAEAVAELPTEPAGEHAKHWTERRFGECAYPVSGAGADVVSCCSPTDGATYCAAHLRIMHAPSKANTGLKKATGLRYLRRAA